MLTILWISCLWKLILFYSLLEGFRTSLQIFHITSCDILHLVEFFKQSLFSNLLLKTPTFQGWLDGRSWSCMPYIENYFKLEHDWEDRLYELNFDIIVVSIGIIGFFLLVSILTFSCILIYVCMYVCFSISIVSISIGIKNFHTYIFCLC